MIPEDEKEMWTMSEQILQYLDSKWANAYNRILIAKHSNTPEDILKILSEDKEDLVRMHIAMNPNTSIETLKVLSGDKENIIKSVVRIPLLGERNETK